MEWNEKWNGTTILVWNMEDKGNGMKDNLPYIHTNSILSKKRSSLFENCVHKLIISRKQCLHFKVHVVWYAGTLVRCKDTKKEIYSALCNNIKITLNIIPHPRASAEKFPWRANE